MCLTINRVTLGEEERIFSQQEQTAVNRAQQNLTGGTQTLKQELWTRDEERGGGGERGQVEGQVEERAMRGRKE